MPNDSRSERRGPHSVVALLCAAGALAAAAPTLAQPPDAEPPRARTERIPPATDRDPEDVQRELEAARRGREEAALERAEARYVQGAERELEAARRNLEQAAREVARLSAEVVAPLVDEFQVQWRGAGQGAMLGLVVEDANDGARITAISPGGPAESAGARIDDVIVAVDGEPLRAPGRRPSRVLIERLSAVEPGTRVAMRVQRDGTTEEMSVETRERGQRAFAFEAPRLEILRNAFRPAGRWSSMELAPLTAELGAYFGTERGLLVMRRPDDDSLLLQDGDVILAIGGREPNSPEHAMRILGTFEAGETVELTIMRHQQQQTLAIPLE